MKLLVPFLLLIPLALSRPNPMNLFRRGGPLGPVFEDLDDKQKAEFKQIWRDNKDKPRKAMKTAVDEFVKKLTKEQQVEVEKNKAKYDKRKEKDDAKAEKLSDEAKKLYDDAKTIMKNDDLTFREAFKAVQELIHSAKPTVLQEFKKNHVRIPGGRPFHGGPLTPIYNDLDEAKQKELSEIMEKNFDKPKKEGKKAFEDFVKTLPEAIQKKYAEAEKKREEHKKENAKNAEKLSPKAKELFDKIQSIKHSDDLTRAQVHDQVHDAILDADKNVLTEFREKKVHLFDLGPHFCPAKGSASDSEHSESDDDDKPEPEAEE
ncbi:unnamed protein product [Bursaphelenchus xylophilus]|uniref:(pine wood nematode) hypothetical protein n=1 Tax=Bursaphelenchus xylophilus TaxID=6326 RepID=A0A1I7SCG7_BURXY|nr:unnamed protein product [Bursaphelenchus xylophilus]CAG9094126.1 unnamed protein product [Bursaphelenchus xylophilus]